METAGKKNSDTQKKTLHFKKLLYSSFLFSRVFLEIMQSYWEFICYRKLFLTLGNLTLISVNTTIFVKANDKGMEGMEGIFFIYYKLRDT